MAYKVFSQAEPPKMCCEDNDTTELGVLDKTSLTSVVEFMWKFQEDATFTPPTRDVMFDSEKYDIKAALDDDAESVLSQFSELEDLSE